MRLFPPACGCFYRFDIGLLFRDGSDGVVVIHVEQLGGSMKRFG
jgi:hypothetical protein